MGHSHASGCPGSGFISSKPTFTENNKQSGGNASTGLVTQSMQARLNGVSLGLVSYLQNHDPDSLARIKSEGKEASKLLGDLKAEALRGGNKTPLTAIEKAQEDLRAATLNLLAVDHAVVTRCRQALKDSAEALLSVMAQMEAAIRPNQLNASSGAARGRFAMIEDAKKFSRWTLRSDPESTRPQAHLEERWPPIRTCLTKPARASTMGRPGPRAL